MSDELKDRIYHLTTERDEWHLRCELAEAEITRLRTALLEARAVVEDNDVLFAIDRALKPDTGEEP